MGTKEGAEGEDSAGKRDGEGDVAGSTRILEEAWRRSDLGRRFVLDFRVLGMMRKGEIFQARVWPLQRAGAGTRVESSVEIADVLGKFCNTCTVSLSACVHCSHENKYKTSPVAQYSKTPKRYKRMYSRGPFTPDGPLLQRQSMHKPNVHVK